MIIYLLVKFLHVLLAIVAVGFNMTYALWLTRAAKEPDHWDYALRGIRTLDERFANPGYGLLLLTGLTMVFVGNLPLTTFWIAGGSCSGSSWRSSRLESTRQRCAGKSQYWKRRGLPRPRLPNWRSAVG